MTARPLTFYEFFAGGGMARLGLGPEWRCVFANEWDRRKAAAYRAQFGGAELVVEDVAKLGLEQLPGRADLAWASFPCQDLSLAGAGAGLKGARSGTFLPFWRLMEGLIAAGRPPGVIVLENVAGTLTSHGGRDFACILSCLVEGGYHPGALVMDAVRFLPQSRPRLFVVAVRSAGCVARGAPGAWHTKALLRAYDGLPDALQDRWIWWSVPEPPPREQALSALLESVPAGVAWHTPRETERLLSLMSETNRAKVREVQATGKLSAGTVYRRMRRNPETGGRVQRAEVRFDEVAGCLRTPAGGSSRQILLLVEGGSVRSRLLSPREAARLMGIPETYPLPASYRDAYHLFGDGLAAPVVAWLSRHLVTPLARTS